MYHDVCILLLGMCTCFFILGSVNLREQHLYIQSVDDADAGLYFCRARNSRGLTVQNISLIVNGKYAKMMSVTLYNVMY